MTPSSRILGEAAIWRETRLIQSIRGQSAGGSCRGGNFDELALDDIGSAADPA